MSDNEISRRKFMQLVGISAVGVPVASTYLPQKAHAAAGDAGGRVVIATTFDVKTLNPVLAIDVASEYVSRRLYESLTTVNASNGEVIPQLAESWEMSPDNKALTFILRDAKWSDGSPITGEDFRFTAEAVMRSRATKNRDRFQDIVGAEEYASGKAKEIQGISIDGKKITVTLTSASCSGLSRFAEHPIIPRSVFGKYMDPADASKNIDKAAENSAPTVVSGALIFKQWVLNNSITLVRNPNFWRGPAKLDEVVFRVLANNTAVASALKTGEADISMYVSPNDFDSLSRAGVKVQGILAPIYTYIAWNQLRGGKEFFQSKRVRQALAYGLNTKLLVERVYAGHGTRNLAHTSPLSWAAPTGLNPYDYDVAKAKQLLADDGWKPGSDGVLAKDGQRLAFEIVTNSGNQERALMLQVAAEQYKKLGVEVTPRVEALAAFVDRLNVSKDPVYGAQGGHDYDAVLFGLGFTSADPDMYANWHSASIGGGGNNVTGYHSAKLDKAVEMGRSGNGAAGSCDQPARKAAYEAANKELNEEQPMNFGVSPHQIMGANPKLQGLKPGPWPSVHNGCFHNIHEWSFSS